MSPVALYMGFRSSEPFQDLLFLLSTTSHDDVRSVLSDSLRRKWGHDSIYFTPGLPVTNATNQAYFCAIQAAKCELYMTIHKVVCTAFPNEENPKSYSLTSWRQLLEYHKHLMSWYDSLPDSIAPNASLSPQHLLFQ